MKPRAGLQGPVADIAAIVVRRERIRERIGELATEVAAAYPAGELTVVGVMNGAMVFLADLLRELPLRVRVETVGVQSRRGRDTAPGRVEFTHGLTGPVTDRHILVVDDVLDTGATLQAVLEEVARQRPASCRSCVLLRKVRSSAADAGRPSVDFVGFDIGDTFVVGYGLDFDGSFRNLPDIVVLKEHLDSST